MTGQIISLPVTPLVIERKKKRESTHFSCCSLKLYLNSSGYYASMETKETTYFSDSFKENITHAHALTKLYCSQCVCIRHTHNYRSEKKGQNYEAG